MVKKIATAALIAGGMLVMGGSAFADNPVGPSDYDLLKATSKSGHCAVQDGQRECTNWNSGSGGTIR